MQQQDESGRMWRLRWEGYENAFITPLMGWHGATDSQYQTWFSLAFPTSEAAEEFCKRQGWTYEIDPDHKKTSKKKSYSENFRWKGFPKEQKKSE
jgi:NADH dehydrogenase (ubiquinone) Fe-S protein 4